MGIGIYIHVPFCAQKCPYCDFYSEAYRKESAEAYTNALIRNLRAHRGLSVDSIFLGGGTPSLLPVNLMNRIFDAIYDCFNVEADTEITIEVNPNTAQNSRLKEWKAMGINRLSFGVQSLLDSELKALGRTHTATQAMERILCAADMGFDNISADLMLGIPDQTRESLKKSFDLLQKLPLTHLSAYLLKLEEKTPFGKGCYEGQLPSEDISSALYLDTVEYAAEMGMHQYEISNFAKGGFLCTHNMKYWQCRDFLGLGPAAHGCFQGIRYAVPDALHDFSNADLQNEILIDDAPCDQEERLMLALRLTEGISKSDFEDKWDALYQFGLSLKDYAIVTENRIALTPKGFLVSNWIISGFMERL